MFFKSEIKKLFRFRLFWIMIAAFLAFNIFIVINNYTWIGNGVQIVNSYVQSGMQPKDDEYGFCANFDDAKENAVHQYYDTLDIKALLKQIDSSSVHKKSSLLNRIIDKNYDKVEKRIEQIKFDGEAENVYYVGTTFSMHDSLYTMLYTVLFECVAIAILMTAYIMNYEKLFKTYQSIYSSKRGRALVFSKGLAASVSAVFASIILIGATLSVFFSRIPQLQSFLQSSVSSAMATERRGLITYPFITWIKMSQLQYLLVVIVIMLVYTILASLITFVLSFLSKNAFINAALTALTYLAFYTAWFGFPNGTILSMVQVFNPSIAMSAMGNWFMEFVFSQETSYPGYETLVAFAYIALSLLITLPLWEHFKKKDIN